MSKDLWIMEVEQAQEAFMEDGDEEAFTASLKALGFDPDEIMDEIAAGNGELTIESAAAGITDIARDLDAIWEDKTTVERAADEIPTINRLTGLPMFHRTTRPPRRS